MTAVTTTHKLEMVRSIGADEAIDYTQEDVTRGGRRFDVILDVGGYASLPRLNRSLAPGARPSSSAPGTWGGWPLACSRRRSAHASSASG